MDDWTALGPHRYRLDGDMLYWRPAGEVLPEHVDAVCALLRQITDQYGYALWLVDALRSIPVGYESRRRYLHWLTQWQGALFMAVFRATVPASTAADLTMRAVRMLTSSEIESKTFDTEAAAWTYLREQAATQLRPTPRLGGAGSLH